MIEGKASNITIDGCEELGVVFSDSVSGVESVNSKKLQIQCNGHTPHVQFDKVSVHGSGVGACGQPVHSLG